MREYSVMQSVNEWEQMEENYRASILGYTNDRELKWTSYIFISWMKSPEKE